MNWIDAEQFSETEIVMVLVNGCYNCTYYENKAIELGIPILKLSSAFEAPFEIIELDGKVLSPALWVGNSKTISPSNLLLDILAKHLRNTNQNFKTK